MDKGICSINECDKPARNRGWCSAHYERWRRHGDPYRGGPLAQQHRGPCIVVGCGLRPEARGLCSTHYMRWRKHGDPLRVDPGGRPADQPTYKMAHDRVQRERGRASDHTCVDCGGPAAEWSYSEWRSPAFTDSRGLMFSMDPDDYEPRCKRCHIAFDSVAERAWVQRRKAS